MCPSLDKQLPKFMEMLLTSQKAQLQENAAQLPSTEPQASPEPPSDKEKASAHKPK